MKKYIGTYLILFAILFIIFLTDGIPYGKILLESSKNREMVITDLGNNKRFLLTYNMIIALIVLIIGFVITCLKNNKLRLKWLFPISMLVFIIALVPLFNVRIRGGVIDRNYEFYLSLLMLLKPEIYFKLLPLRPWVDYDLSHTAFTVSHLISQSIVSAGSIIKLCVFRHTA